MAINNLKISIRSAIYYEKLADTPFSKYNDNTADKLILLYCILISHKENNYHKTFEEFMKEDFNSHLLKDLLTKLNDEIAFMSQFNKNKKEEQVFDNQPDTSTNEDNAIWIKDVVPILVDDCGLDINFVLDDLSYTDIEDYLRYRDEKRKANLLEKRLFTYLTILPHIDTKKKKFGPEDLLPFSWEEKEKKNKAIKDINDEELRKKLIAAGIIKEKEED